MNRGRRWLRAVLAGLGALVLVWIVYRITTIRAMSGRVTDSGCASDPNAVAEYSQLPTEAKRVPCQSWDVGTGVAGYTWQAPNAKAVVLMEHGWGDYAQRYVRYSSQLIPQLLARGVSVYAIDMWGNGRSPGARGATDVNHAVDDHLAARRTLGKQSLPVYVLGHSVGGLVTAASVLRNPDGVQGMILIAPALKWDVGGIARFVARAGALLIPTLGMPIPPGDPAAQSRDPAFHERLANDSLYYRGPISWVTAGTGATTAQNNWKEYHRITLPVLTVSGTADQVTPPGGLQEFVDRIQSQDKTLHLVEGGRHALLDDPPASEEALRVILEWLEHRLARVENVRR